MVGALNGALFTWTSPQRWTSLRGSPCGDFGVEPLSIEFNNFLHPTRPTRLHTNHRALYSCTFLHSDRFPETQRETSRWFRRHRRCSSICFSDIPNQELENFGPKSFRPKKKSSKRGNLALEAQRVETVIPGERRTTNIPVSLP